MCSGGVGCVLATWHSLRGGFNAPLHVTLGFPAVFSVSCAYFLLFLPYFSLSLLLCVFRVAIADLVLPLLL